MYAIGYAISRVRSPSIAQIVNEFAALAGKIVQDADGDWVLSGVNLGTDSRGRPIKAFATMALAVASNLTNAQKNQVIAQIQASAPYAQALWYSALTDEATLTARLRQFLGEQGADQVWMALWDTPTTTTTTADLLAQFGPV